MKKKGLSFADWEPCTEYVNGDVFVDRLRKGRKRLIVFWNRSFHECGLPPTEKNVDAVSRLLHSMKGKP